MIDQTAYLMRINYQGELNADLTTLRNLQLAHLYTVPFENLSVAWGQPITLTDEALFQKVVERRRGGFCYELNGLFAALLRSLGFGVEMLSAEVARSDGSFGPPFDHMTLLVTLEDRWLVDVGFGDSFREPLLLDSRSEQRQGGRRYRIDSAENRLILMQRKADSDWEPQFRFDDQPHVYADFVEMCRYHQTSPQSPFTQRATCSLARSDGRITITNSRLITTIGDQRTEQDLNDDEVKQVLQEKFGIAWERGCPHPQ